MGTFGVMRDESFHEGLVLSMLDGVSCNLSR